MDEIRQKGQALIILLLIMLVMLSIGLALTQRSVTDVTTSTQAEQATRAYSAAEAGIEKALSSPLPIGYTLPLDNNSSAVVDSSGLMPYAANVGIEYPPIGRETTAQFWFLDSTQTTNPPTGYYTGSTVDLYFGNAGLTADYPAVEVKIVALKNNSFVSKSYYYDSSSTRTTGANDNNFTFVNGCGTTSQITTILGTARTFYCIQTIAVADPTDTTSPYDTCNSGVNCVPVLMRVRFLYINTNQKLALMPSTGAQLPPQVQIFNALGTSGQSQRQIQAFKVRDVVLPWFDFAIFSTNEIRK